LGVQTQEVGSPRGVAVGQGTEGGRDALSVLWKCRHPGEGFAPAEDHVAIRRRRFCPACGGRFTTYERVQLRDLVVIKSNGKREDFDRDKLERSVRIALQKRPVEPERMDQMMSGIVRRLESMGETDIQSKVIGEIVMERLAAIDTVAYVRFASVYKNFQATDDFEDFLAELRPPTSLQSGDE
jgi:transcriptional repressor NrdR